jgi:hypothetical protein
MSGFPTDAKLGNVLQDDGPPRHRVHNSDDPLPGSHVDQQPAEVQQLSDRNLPQEEAALRAQSHNAFNSERPLDVHPTRAGKCRCPFPKSATDAKLFLRNLQGALLVPVKTTSLWGRLVCWTRLLERWKRLRSWISGLFRRSDTMVCRSSARLLIMPRGMKPVSFVRLVGRRQSLVRRVRRTTKDWNCWS